jgi:hypothetical protein
MLDQVFDSFVKDSPVSVMFRGTFRAPDLLRNLR